MPRNHSSTNLLSLSRSAYARAAHPSSSVSLAVLIVVFGTITVLRWFCDRAGQDVEIFYVIPIALGAIWFGWQAGLGLGILGSLAFLVLSSVHGGGDLDVSGRVGPVLSMLVVGGLVGYSTDVARHRGRLVRHHLLRSRHLDVIRRRHQALLAESDSILQRMVALRWMLEAGRNNEALDVLDTMVAQRIAELTPHHVETDRGLGGPPADGTAD